MADRAEKQLTERKSDAADRASFRIRVIAGQASDDLEEKINAWLDGELNANPPRYVTIEKFVVTIEGELIYFTAYYTTERKW